MERAKEAPVRLLSVKTKPAIVHLAAFLLPLLGLAVAFAAVGIFPFGANSILTLDLKSQYITFFSYLRNDVFLGGGDFFYTFSKALGGDMAGFSAYYLLSPLNILLVLFPTEMLPVGINLIILLKVGCCGLCMSFLLCEEGARLDTLLFSVPYALMDFVIAFHFNVMWLDSVALLPLVVLGIRRLWRGKSPLLYVLSLAGAIICNYYIGYMVCLFSALYFVVLVLFGEKPPVASGARPRALAPVWRFMGASAIGGGLSAVVLLPAMLSLSGGKAQFAAGNFFDESFATLADVVSRYMPGTASTGQVFFGYPAIYVGMLALLCTALFFFNRGIPLKTRIGGGVLLVALLLSFCVGPLDRLWHGLNKPVGFLYRYSFVFSFLLLYLGWQGFSKIRGRMVRRHMPLILAAFFCVMLLARQKSHDYLTPGKFALGMGLAVGFALLIWLHTTKKWKYSLFFLAAFVLLDMGSNMYLSIRHAGYLPLEAYASFVRKEQPAVDFVKRADAGFYRLEKKHAYSDNDAFLLGYNGLSHFSSADKMFVREFLDAMGLSDGGYGVKYADGTTVAMESLLGVKYLLTTGAGTVKPYDKMTEIAVDDDEIRQVWHNPMALPLGFMAGEAAAAQLPEGGNLFEVYNAMWHAIDPELPENIYRTTAFELMPAGINVREFEEEVLYEKLADDCRVEFQITAESDDMLYALFTTTNERNVDMYINGSYDGRFLFNDRHGVLPLGRFAPGQVVTVALAPVEWELFLTDAVFAYEDSSLLEQSINKLQTGAYDPATHTSSSFSGTATNAGDGRELLLLSIPFDKGWGATVDGEKTPIQPAFGALTALKLPQGEHQVMLRYTPPGLWVGLAITGGSLTALLLWIFVARRARKTGA